MPKRTASSPATVRLRMLEEAESCTQPGEVGRLLRREGLYSSHLTEWRRARREGSLQGLTPSKRGRKPARAQPPQREGARARGESGSAGEGAAHRPYDPGRPSKSCRAAGIRASNTGRTADGRPAARIAGRRGAGVPSAGGATGFLLPSSEARSRASAAPSYARPGPCVRPNARTSLDVLASPRFVDRSPAEVVATLLDEGQYLCAERTMYRILAANQPVRERRTQLTVIPEYAKPELVATGAQPDLRKRDITRLRGPKRWTSASTSSSTSSARCVVGWMVADRENAALRRR